jgi:hypothetical protein
MPVKRGNKRTPKRGFSSGVQSHNQRLLKPDGTFNIEVRGLPWFRPSDAFEQLIKMSWWKFMFMW